VADRVASPLCQSALSMVFSVVSVMTRNVCSIFKVSPSQRLQIAMVPAISDSLGPRASMFSASPNSVPRLLTTSDRAPYVVYVTSQVQSSTEIRSECAGQGPSYASLETDMKN
jgi:hypothetical protein